MAGLSSTLFDEDQSVAQACNVACAPDAFLYNSSEELFYRGQFDDSRASGGDSTGLDIKNAISLLVKGDNPPSEQNQQLVATLNGSQNNQVSCPHIHNNRRIMIYD